MQRSGLQIASGYAALSSDAAVESDVLKGRHVHVLDNSCADTAEKQRITDTFVALGAAPTFRPLESRGDDICIAGSAPRRKLAPTLRRHAKQFPLYDVLHARWLVACKARRRLLQPRPADYLYLSDRTLAALMEQEGRDECATCGPAAIFANI